MQPVVLPIDLYIEDILNKIKRNASVILTASPGSGKTTRLPAALIKAELFVKNKKIIILVPKRLAAIAACVRIAEEQQWTVGKEVGYQVRFEKEYSNQTQLIFMTEGVFLKKLSEENFMRSIGLVVFDEFHERTSLADLSLGLCYERQLLEENPSEQLKILVMSATLNTDQLKKFLNTEAVLEISAPPHPLQIIYSTKGQRLICDDLFYNQLSEVMKTAWQENRKDILCFLPGLTEIRKATITLQKSFSDEQIKILHSSVSLTEQQLLLKPSSGRKIILSTNIAESSLTLPNVDAVIDSGLQKQSKIEPKIGFSRLELHRISLFSAQQRAGRAARTAAGRCYRLWHETDELSMSEKITPEILKSNLINECLTLSKFHITDGKSFSFLDQPSEDTYQQAQSKLKSWGLIDETGHISQRGEKIESCPLDTERSLLLVELATQGYANIAADFIAALETVSFSEAFSQKKLISTSDLDYILEISLTKKKTSLLKNQISHWLKHNDLWINTSREEFFLKSLTEIYFKYFPEKIGQIKSGQAGTSSFGRGFQLLPGLSATKSDYALLISGRELSSATTQIEFALGISKADFIKYADSQLKISKHYEINFQKNTIYQIQQKRIGQFVVSESSKIPLDVKQVQAIWPEILKDNLNDYLNENEEFKVFLIRQNFLKKHQKQLNLNSIFFKEIGQLQDALEKILLETTTGFQDLNQAAIEYYLLSLFDPEFKKTYQNLPSHFKLPNGKLARIDYESERAPLISVRIQDLLGQKTNPAIVSEQLVLTIELLAPNHRPAQITSQLVQFWKNGYRDIAKELKARYPKHAWPDDPMNFIPVVIQPTGKKS